MQLKGGPIIITLCLCTRRLLLCLCATEEDAGFANKQDRSSYMFLCFFCTTIFAFPVPAGEVPDARLGLDGQS